MIPFQPANTNELTRDNEEEEEVMDDDDDTDVRAKNSNNIFI